METVEKRESIEIKFWIDSTSRTEKFVDFRLEI